MPRLLPALAACFAAATLLACRGQGVQAMSAVPNPSAAPGGQNSAPLTATPRNAQLSTTRDGVVAIVVEGLATAGYEWTVAPGTLDEKVLRFKGKRYGEISGAAMPGKSAPEIFEFVGVAPGQARVTLVNARPWEKDQPPADTATYTVIVK